MLVSALCEAFGAFHMGQYGCRARRSAVDAVAIMIAQTQEAWRQGRIVGALLVDVAAAFPSVARGCRPRKMRNIDIDENLVEWINSFMRDRKVIMSIGGQERKLRMSPQGPHRSRPSPRCSSRSISLKSMRRPKPKSRAAETSLSSMISFVDDVTWGPREPTSTRWSNASNDALPQASDGPTATSIR